MRVHHYRKPWFLAGSLAAGLLLLPGLAAAQGPGFGFRPGPLGFGPELAFAPAPGTRPHGPVTGAPFSGSAQIQITHENQSGQPVTDTSTLQLARDDSGRTWVEVNTPANGNYPAQQVIYINDPVAHVSYVVYPSSQDAFERKLPQPRDVSSNNPPPPHPPSGFGRGGRGPKPTITQLASQTFANGQVEATGVQSTITLPGRGNGSPVTQTTVTYYSTSSQILAMEQRSGPHGSQQTYTLESYTAGAPSVSFSVPSNYVIHPAGGPWGGRGRG